MIRILLTIAIAAVGYDAVVHRGAYTSRVLTSTADAAGCMIDEASCADGRAPERPAQSQTN